MSKEFRILEGGKIRIKLLFGRRKSDSLRTTQNAIEREFLFGRK
jgi:hypothetical protein